MTLDRLLPEVIDNSYRGRKPALWLLGLMVFVKTAMGLNSIFNGPVVLTSADGVPLPSYPDPAVRAVVAMFALWALGQIILALLGLLALVRYRAMTAVVFALMLSEHLARKAILQALPIDRSGAAPASAINMVLLGLMAAGLVLSLWRGTSRNEAAAPAS